MNLHIETHTYRCTYFYHSKSMHACHQSCNFRSGKATFYRSRREWPECGQNQAYQTDKMDCTRRKEAFPHQWVSRYTGYLDNLIILHQPDVKALLRNSLYWITFKWGWMRWVLWWKPACHVVSMPVGSVWCEFCEFKTSRFSRQIHNPCTPPKYTWIWDGVVVVAVFVEVGGERVAGEPINHFMPALASSPGNINVEIPVLNACKIRYILPSFSITFCLYKET